MHAHRSQILTMMAPSPRRILTLTVLLWGHMGMVVQASYVAKWKEVADIPQQLSDMTATTVSDKVTARATPCSLSPTDACGGSTAIATATA